MKQLKRNQIYYSPQYDEIYICMGTNPYILSDETKIYVIDIATIDWSKLFLIGEL